MTAKKVDWPEVRKNIPAKPVLWECNDLCAFLEGHDLSSVVDAFKENSIDGNVFMSLEDDDDSLWKDLDLTNREVKFLKQYKNQLKEYNKNFNDYDPKKAANINQIKSQLENFTGKKRRNLYRGINFVRRRASEKTD
jgi:hypothetical protein